MSKKRPSLLFPVSVLPSVLLLPFAAGCGRERAEGGGNAPKPMPLVQIAKAERRELSKTATFTGSVEPVKVARMASPAEGPIAACTVREGDSVRKGQILVKVGRSRIAETGLEAAREEFRRQETEFQRVERLVKSGFLPSEQLEVARANVKRAEANVAAMETGASDYEIAAPWDGVVSKVWVAEGNFVAPRAPLVEMIEPASLVIRMSVPERQALALQTNQPVRVTLDAYPNRRFNGRLIRLYPELERTTRTLTAEAVVEDDVKLLSGMFARVDVTVQTLPDAVTVPASALLVLPNGESVSFILEGDKAVRRKVKVAMEAGETVAIESGIQAEEMVISRGNETLKDGATVQVMGLKKPEGGGSGSATGTVPVRGSAEPLRGKGDPAS